MFSKEIYECAFKYYDLQSFAQKTGLSEQYNKYFMKYLFLI